MASSFIIKHFVLVLYSFLVSVHPLSDSLLPWFVCNSIFLTLLPKANIISLVVQSKAMVLNL